MQNLANSNGCDNSGVIPQLFLDDLKGLGIDFFDLIDKISRLPKLDKKLVVADYDDTLFTREHQLQLNLFQDNRGDKGNEVIKRELGGYDEFIRKFYQKQFLTQEIFSIVKNNISVILTAGEKELQHKKIRSTGLNAIPTLVVDKSHMKPIALLKYIINLGFIPSSIEIYDDRVKYFRESCDFLSQILDTQIDVFEVKLKGTELDSLNQYTYLNNGKIILANNDFLSETN